MPFNCWMNYYSHSAYRLTNKMFASQALKEQNILSHCSILPDSFHIWSDPPETFFAGFKATVIAFATVTENNWLKIKNRRKNSMISVFLQKCWNPLSVKTAWEPAPSIDYNKSCMAKTYLQMNFCSDQVQKETKDLLSRSPYHNSTNTCVSPCDPIKRVSTHVQYNALQQLLFLPCAWRACHSTSLFQTSAWDWVEVFSYTFYSADSESLQTANDFIK